MKRPLLFLFIFCLQACHFHTIEIDDSIKNMDWKSEIEKNEGNARLCLFRENNLFTAKAANYSVYLNNLTTNTLKKVAVLSNDDFVCMNRKEGLYRIIVPQRGWDDVDAEIYLPSNQVRYVNLYTGVQGLVIRIENDDSNFKKVKN